MFLMIGISEGVKEFDFHQMATCAQCGRWGSYAVYMTYTVLSLFFIPCFKWNRQYFVRMSCCGAVYQLDPEVGKRIAKGEDVEIRPEDLSYVSGNFSSDGFGPGETTRWANWTNEVKTCSHCGYTTDEDFDFCPKCGNRF